LIYKFLRLWLGYLGIEFIGIDVVQRHLLDNGEIMYLQQYQKSKLSLLIEVFVSQLLLRKSEFFATRGAYVSVILRQTQIFLF